MSESLTLAEQLKKLEQVQEIDLKIDLIKNNKNSLPLALRQADDTLRELKKTVDSKAQVVSETEKAQRQTVAALELNQDRLSRASQKLEAVHNSQEFQAANKEIDQLKKLNASLEEQSKKSSVDLEALKGELSLLTTKISDLQKSRESQAEVVTGQETQLKSDIAGLTTEREKYLTGVESRLLSQYNRIRAARNGLGIVPAVGGRCKACNMMLPPQLFNEIQKGTILHSCPSCHRILLSV